MLIFNVLFSDQAHTSFWCAVRTRTRTEHSRGQLEAGFLFTKYMEMLANLREMSDIMQHKTIKNFTPFPTVDQEIKSLIR